MCTGTTCSLRQRPTTCTVNVAHLDEHLLKLFTSVVDEELLEPVASEGLESEDIDERDSPGRLLIFRATAYDMSHTWRDPSRSREYRTKTPCRVHRGGMTCVPATQ